ncbi:MAG: Gfo/Idh/MocA family protein [Bryobacteraceae bacterium]
MQRREFLGTAAGGLATAAAAPAGGGVLATPEQAATRKKLRVGIVGCGRMGQYFAEVYRRLPDTELAAIAEYNDERRKVVGERFGVKALYKDVHAMLREQVPDIVAIITPTKFMKDAVIASAEAGVKGVSTDKPIAASLVDADAMVEACRRRNIVYAGGNLQRARWQIQEAGRRLRSGEYGKITGAAVLGFGGEISGGGCQHVSVLRLFTGAEVAEVMAWGHPPEALARDDDGGLIINGRFRMTNGIECLVFGDRDKTSDGVQIWSDSHIVRWNWDSPRISQSGVGGRKEVAANYPPFLWKHVLAKPPLRDTDDYLVSSIRSFVDAVHGSKNTLFVSGHDLRQALEVAIASKLSAQLGNQPVKLPLKDRTLALLPSPYRWVGGDAAGRPQTAAEAAGER